MFISADGVNGNYRALVVGIDDYGEGPHDLPSCIADAGAAASLLRDTYGFRDVRELHDADATLARLAQALGDLTASAGPDDRVVFFFSGHGAQVLKDGVLRECLVAQDLGLLEDDVLVAATAGLPRGVLTVALDACFAGGMWQGRSKRKSLPGGAAVEKTIALRYRPFGGAERPAVGPFIASRKTLVVRPSPAEGRQASLNGLLVAACLENETASANTPDTCGLSAFTFALTKAIAALGPHAPADAVVDRAGAELRAVGVSQTPQIHCPVVPADMNVLTLFDAAAASAAATAAAPPTPPSASASDAATDLSVEDNNLTALARATATAAIQLERH
jgi:hypothetical protein